MKINSFNNYEKIKNFCYYKCLKKQIKNVINIKIKNYFNRKKEKENKKLKN